MDKKIAGLLGAAAALSTLGAAQATAAPAVDQMAGARSYAELLEPVPNAAEQLKADEAAQGEVQLAQLYIYRDRYRHHHHHHHHYRYY